MLGDGITNVFVVVREGKRFHAHLCCAVIYCKLRLDHHIHQLQERQSTNYLPSRDNIGVRVHFFVGEEGSIAGLGHGALEEVVKYHNELKQLDLLAVREDQVPNCIGIEGLDLHVI